MSDALSIARATQADVASIERLLLFNQLPANDIGRHAGDFVIARAGDRVIGAAGMERYPPYALLRSVVVDARWRRQGIARMLTQEVVHRATESGLARMYLLTETAADCFARMGFVPCPRESFPGELADAPQVAGLCCASAQAMMRSL